MVKVLFVLVPVEDRKTQHAAGDGLRLLQQLVQMHHGIIWRRQSQVRLHMMSSGRLKRRQKWEYREREMLCEMLAGWNETRTAYEGFIKKTIMLAVTNDSAFPPWRHFQCVLSVSPQTFPTNVLWSIHIRHLTHTHTHSLTKMIQWDTLNYTLTQSNLMRCKRPDCAYFDKVMSFFCQVKTALINPHRGLFSLRGVRRLQSDITDWNTDKLRSSPK